MFVETKGSTEKGHGVHVFTSGIPGSGQGQCIKKKTKKSGIRYWYNILVMIGGVGGIKWDKGDIICSEM
jgi:hypothetical protein